MPAAALPCDETKRQAALSGYGLSTSGDDAISLRLVREAAKTFDVPIAAISLVADRRQVFKAETGLGIRQTPREVSFCAHAILGDEPLIVEDASQDSRFADNSLVQGPPFIRFYAGAPLINAEGYKLGAFCVIDRKPRQLSVRERLTLVRYSHLAMRRLELLRTVADLSFLMLAAPGNKPSAVAVFSS